jgi:hypothetical protein
MSHVMRPFLSTPQLLSLEKGSHFHSDLQVQVLGREKGKELHPDDSNENNDSILV